ncbi:MAG TPA: winged helix-turn-helix domain-containing protein [Microthrixaceae bacterium]|nr:winged helix-turn-helix domain-containing protein [Microthrixaceae bacterium]
MRREAIGSGVVQEFDLDRLDPTGEPRVLILDGAAGGPDELDQLLASDVDLVHCSADEAAICFRPGVDVLIVRDGGDPIEQALVIQQLLALAKAPPANGQAARADDSPAPTIEAPAAATVPDDEPGTVRLGPLVLMPGRQMVESFDKAARLRPREVELLAHFMAHPGETFSRQDLMEAVWGYTIGDPSTVTVHIRRLREKIEPDPTKPILLVTMWGAGYSLDIAGATAVMPAIESSSSSAQPFARPPEPLASPAPAAPTASPSSGAIRQPVVDESALAVTEEVATFDLAALDDPRGGDWLDAAEEFGDDVRIDVPPLPPDRGGPDTHPVRPGSPPPAGSSRSAHSAPPVRPSSRRHRTARQVASQHERDDNGWGAATELAVTRVLDDLAALSRDRSQGGVSPRLWMLFEAVASLRLEGEVIEFEDAVMALVGGTSNGDDRVTRYIDGLEAATEPFADRERAVASVGADPVEPLLDLGVLIARDPTLFSHRAPLSGFALALARFDVDPGRVGPAPRTLRGALSTWPARTGRSDVSVALSYVVGSKPLWVPGTSLAEERVPSLLLAMSDATRRMRAAERRVRQLRRSYLDEVADNSSLHLVQMIEMFTRDPVVTVERITEQLGVSHQTIRNNLRRLESAEWLVEIGSYGRGGRKHWYAPAVFDAMTYGLTQDL